MTSALEFVAGVPGDDAADGGRRPRSAGSARPRTSRPRSLYLSSRAGQYVTGKMLEVDGGIQEPNLDLGPARRAARRLAQVTPDQRHRPRDLARLRRALERAEGAWPVAAGIHRIPLPLPMDGLKAVNVYAIETDDGLTLIDGGWAIEVAPRRCSRSRCATSATASATSRRFLVTHVHRDHYTHGGRARPRVRRRRRLGLGEKPTLDLLNDLERPRRGPVRPASCAGRGARTSPRSGATFTERRERPTWRCGPTPTPGSTATTRSRSARARSTPSTRPATRRATTCSPTAPTGCSSPATTCCRRSRRRSGSTGAAGAQPAGRLPGSLTKVRGLPDLRLLPAHGPVAPSSHARVDELLAHHEDAARAVPRGGPARGPATGVRRRGRAAAGPGTSTRYADLDVFNGAWPRMETKAHLELLVARGQATRADDRRRRRVFSGRLSRIGRCGMPSSRNSGPSTSNPKTAYQPASGDWASSTTSRSGQTSTARSSSAGRPARGRGARREHDPADPPRRRRRRGRARSRPARRRRRGAARGGCPGSRSRPSRSG